MSTITRTYDFANGSTADADQVDTDFNTIYDEFNGNIDNTNIASGAGIDTAKLELGTGSDNNTILNNNKYHQAKDTSGTAQNLIGMDASDNIELGDTDIDNVELISEPVASNAEYYQAKQSGGTIKDLLGLTANNHLALGEIRRQGGSTTNWATGGTTDYTTGKFTIQVGSTGNVGAASSVTVTFPQAFSDVPIVLAIGATSTNANFTALANSTTQATIYNHNASLDRPAYWIAIGPV